jgi:tetratricopeptide (TPR) repeat protein
MRFTTAIMLLAPLVGALQPAIAENPSADDLQRAMRYTNRGTKALTAGNLSKARGNFLDAVKIVPTYPDAHAGLGHVEMREREFEAALFSFEQARHGYSQIGGALFAIRMRRYADAQENVVELRHRLAVLERRLGGNAGSGGKGTYTLRGETMRVQRAIQQMEAIQVPTSADAGRPPGEISFFIGNALLNLDRIDEAIEAWQACARETPSFALVYNNLAVASWMQGDPSRAWAYLQRANELGFPGNPGFRDTLEQQLAAQRPAVPIEENQPARLIPTGGGN